MKSRALFILAIFLAPFALGQMWEATRIGQQQWELVSDDDKHISWHQTGEEANEKGQKWSLEHGLRSFITRHTGTRWDATAFAQTYPGANDSLPEGEVEPPNDPPVWNNTPAPTFIEGVVASYDLAADCSDPEADGLAFVNEAGCILPTGNSIDNVNDELDEDGTSPVATTTSCVFSCDDGTNSPVDSSAFSIVVTAIPGAGTIYERDMFGTPRTGTSGAVERLGAYTGNPIAELNDIIPIDISDYTCDATVTTGDGDWTTKVNDSGNAVVCIAAGDHSAKGSLVVSDGGSAGTTRTISAITLNDPVRVDFTAAHGWTTNDIIHCNEDAGGTWEMRWRYFRVTVIDSDSVDLQGQDGTGAGTRPAWVTYTSGGTCQAPNWKVIRHAVDLAVHPVQLADGDRAKAIRFECGSGSASTDYLMVIGLSIDHKGLAASINMAGNVIHACDYFIYDQNHDYNVEALTDIEADFRQSGLSVDNAGADTLLAFNQIQRNFFDERGIDGIGTDSHWWNGTSPVQMRGLHLIANETSSAMSGWQVLGQSGTAQEGFLMAENSDWLDTSQYTDCAGNVVGGTTFGADDNSQCAVAESAGAFKQTLGNEGRVAVTNATRHRIPVVDANQQCCRRKEDGVISDGGSGGQSYGLSAGSAPLRNVLWRNNIGSANNRSGIFPIKVFSATQNYMTKVGNLEVDVTATGSPAKVMAWWSPAGDTLEKMEVIFNTIVTADRWLEAPRLTDSTLECNLFIDANERGSMLGSYAQKNNYGYGNTVDMDGTGDNDGGVASNANMADLTVLPKLYSDPTFEYTLAGVLPTASSPHVGDCPSIGTADQGVTDATVAF